MSEPDVRRRLDQARQASEAAERLIQEGKFDIAIDRYKLACSRLKGAQPRSDSDKDVIRSKFDEYLQEVNSLHLKLGLRPLSPEEITSDLKSTISRTPSAPISTPSELSYPELPVFFYPDPTSTTADIPCIPVAPVSQSPSPDFFSSTGSTGSTEGEKPAEEKEKQKRHRSHSSHSRQRSAVNLSDRIVKIADYRKVKPLGHGSFGSVYCAQQRATGQLVAIKILQTEFQSQEEQITFLREVENLMRADHPAVLRFVGFSLRSSDEEPCPAIVTEYHPNGSVQDILDKKKKTSPTQKMILLYGIAEAMRYLHRRLGIVHRDLKPGNVMLNKDNEPIVGDFGLSKIMTQPRLRQSMVSGSPVYMAPELMARLEYTNKVDVYAFGMMAYEIVTGILAYEDIATVQDLVDQVSRGLRPTIPATVPKPYAELMSRCWSADVNERPSFKEVCAEFTEGHLNLPGCNLEEFQAYMKKLTEREHKHKH